MLNFMLGAFSLWMLICLLQFYSAIKEKREVRSGLWLALGLVKLQAIVLPAAMILGARRWRAAASAIILTLLFVLLSSAILGWHIWQDFMKWLLSTSAYFDAYGVVPQDMYNLKGTLALLLGNEQKTAINAISLAAFLLSILFVILLWSGRWQPEEASFELRLAITILMGILFSPHVNPQDGLLIVMPALLFYIYLRENNLPGHAYAGFVLLCPLVFLLSEFVVAGSFGIRLPALAYMMMGAWMVKYLLYEKRIVAQG
jgi:hypothetical protein